VRNNDERDKHEIFKLVCLLYAFVIGLFFWAPEVRPKPKKQDIEKARKMPNKGDRFSIRKISHAINKDAEGSRELRCSEHIFGKDTRPYYLIRITTSAKTIWTRLAQWGWTKPLEIYKTSLV